MRSLRTIFALVLILSFLAACAETPSPTVPVLPTETSVPATDTPEPSATPEPTETAVPTATATAEPVTIGPVEYPEGINPLTGLEVEDPDLLARRPILVKVENIPRNNRPQYGLSLADIVYEYYTEEGATRFSALFYGQDAETIAPVRSARFFDITLVEMYKSYLVFGGAYDVLRSRLFGSAFADRLITETSRWAPAVKRMSGNQRNLLSLNTAQLQEILADAQNADNTAQELGGMFFAPDAPAGGEEVESVFVRYSSAIYNRWDYDEETGTYLRFVDSENDTQSGAGEVYVQLTDALTEEPIAAENVVVILVPHEIRDPRAGTEVVDMLLLGQGPAYIARDGMLYEVQWQRLQSTDVLHLVDAEGNPFPFKPGQTWFEIQSRNALVEQQDDGAWRFTFMRDW